MTNLSQKKRQPPLLALGNAIKLLRKNRNLTQEGLAAAAKLNLSYVASVERGDNNPTVMTLIALSNALGVTVEQLVADAGL